MSQSADKEAGTQKEESPTQRKLHLLDLPYDILDRVLEKVQIPHHRFIRGASKEMRELQTSHAMHQYEWYVDSYTREENPMENIGERGARIMLTILNNTVEYYLREGYEEQFASNLLYFQYEIFRGRKMPPSSLYDILYRFQHSLEDLPLAGTDDSRNKVRDRRLIYTLTLFSLLRQFDNVRIVESGMHLMHWHVVVELPNIFIGVLAERKVNPRISNSDKRNGFVSILLELLYYVKMNRNFGGFKDAGNVAYSYGFQSDTQTKRKPRLEIKCMVLAPKSVLRLLQDAITGKDVPKKPIHVPPGAVFTARLQVNSKPAKRFYDFGTTHINICQHDEPFQTSISHSKLAAT